MELVTSYTPQTLASFIQQQLADIATFLGWVNTSYPDGDFDEVINSTLLSLDKTQSAELAAITDVQKVRRVAMYHAWKQAQQRSILAIDFTADGLTANRDQIFKHIQEMALTAEAEIAEYGIASGYVATVLTIDRARDPYGLRQRSYYD